eukprot:CAMPEP_0117444934 /NCGR_PEP_ID=MMETSP0759-20121206/5520_1 /TAXON_ID=63605 /ORGANISM="Percolomonas cosmopolitus, Strain WS" /LENGTH=614 /DNA_ID=CAMNT_0005237063 /DNA_START=299 /DNA_END=2143 /DNA_ORIENTATION=+
MDNRKHHVRAESDAQKPSTAGSPQQKRRKKTVRRQRQLPWYEHEDHGEDLQWMREMERETTVDLTRDVIKGDRALWDGVANASAAHPHRNGNKSLQKRPKSTQHVRRGVGKWRRRDLFVQTMQGEDEHHERAEGLSSGQKHNSNGTATMSSPNSESQTVASRNVNPEHDSVESIVPESTADSHHTPIASTAEHVTPSNRESSATEHTSFPKTLSTPETRSSTSLPDSVPTSNPDFEPSAGHRPPSHSPRLDNSSISLYRSTTSTESTSRITPSPFHQSLPFDSPYPFEQAKLYKSLSSYEHRKRKIRNNIPSNPSHKHSSSSGKFHHRRDEISAAYAAASGGGQPHKHHATHHSGHSSSKYHRIASRYQEAKKRPLTPKSFYKAHIYESTLLPIDKQIRKKRRSPSKRSGQHSGERIGGRMKHNQGATDTHTGNGHLHQIADPQNSFSLPTQTDLERFQKILEEPLSPGTRAIVQWQEENGMPMRKHLGSSDGKSLLTDSGGKRSGGRKKRSNLPMDAPLRGGVQKDIATHGNATQHENKKRRFKTSTQPFVPPSSSSGDPHIQRQLEQIFSSPAHTSHINNSSDAMFFPELARFLSGSSVRSGISSDSPLVYQ